MSLTQHIAELCLPASREQDPQKLLSLVDEWNKELDHTTEAPSKNPTLKTESIPTKTGNSNAA